MDHQEIARQFAACIACSQQICRHFAPRLGIDDSLALRMAAAFGSGMGHAGTCGCFTGAMLVLGLRFGPHESATASACTERLAGEIRRFEGLFRQAHGSLLCRDILGIDISSPEGLARACAQGLSAPSVRRWWPGHALCWNAAGRGRGRRALQRRQAPVLRMLPARSAREGPAGSGAGTACPGGGTVSFPPAGCYRHGRACQKGLPPPYGTPSGRDQQKRPEPQGPRPPVVRCQKMLASAFAFFLAGAAQADAGQGLQTLLGDGLTAFAAAGHAVDPVGTALIQGSAGAGEGSFTVQTFKFSGLVKNIHASVSLKQAAIPHTPGLP